VVVAARSALGTINHTLLTVEAARARGLPVAAVVLNRLLGDADPTTRTNRQTLAKRLGGLPVLGPVPRLEPFAIDAAADAVLALGLAG
jgi:dethiobiotin synthetase